MSFSEWKEVSISETILTSNTGLDAIKRAPIVDYDSGIRCLRIQDISQGKDYEDWGFCSVEDRNYLKFQLQKGDIIVARTGATIGVNKLIIKDLKAVYNNGLIRIKLNEDIVDYNYLYYNLQSERYKGHIQAISGGTSTQPNMKMNDLLSFKIKLPLIQEQKAIAKILSTLDEKIEVNKQINKTLEEMAQAIFKQWFADFEFPNGDGEPYKSSGGEMVESELGMIPKGWEVSTLGDIIDIHDSKRIPLSKNEREKREKVYPYYGAAALMDYVDDYIFDGIYVLMGEDGTVADSNGYPILQYVWGKFWVNNHAHVLTGKGNISEEFIYILLKNTNVSSIVTGAVQPKINQQNMKSLKIVLPKDLNLITLYSQIVRESFSMYRNNHDENKILVSLRDTLLPKLMSGEIRVPLKD